MSPQRLVDLCDFQLQKCVQDTLRAAISCEVLSLEIIRGSSVPKERLTPENADKFAYQPHSEKLYPISFHRVDGNCRNLVLQIYEKYRISQREIPETFLRSLSRYDPDDGFAIDMQWISTDQPLHCHNGMVIVIRRSSGEDTGVMEKSPQFCIYIVEDPDDGSESIPPLPTNTVVRYFFVKCRRDGYEDFEGLGHTRRYQSNH
ncbi:hypothetical protein AOQ84DRAFT_70716 [Glonium stellatum]|uniref:Uncharacterized protein n=1 Tax=Glonium stellatum TaxID=574774 RepID=A0A8E2EY22_9PEZI|nr:hypothetical protein AOQ84DRAFT_70716 [Glonium stellatum]